MPIPNFCRIHKHFISHEFVTHTKIKYSVGCPMKTSFYDRIMPEDECKAITRNYEQSIVVENVTFNSKTAHKFTAFLVF